MPASSREHVLLTQSQKANPLIPDIGKDYANQSSFDTVHRSEPATSNKVLVRARKRP